MHFSRAHSKRLQVNAIGIIGVIVLAFLIAFLYASGSSFEGSVFDQPYLTVILQLVFVLGISIAVVMVSSKSYLDSGSLNILLIGCAIFVGSLASTISIWTLSPYVSPDLTTNEAVTIGNIGQLLSSFGLLLSSAFTFFKISPTGKRYRKTFLTAALFVSTLLVGIISVVSTFDLMPMFLTSSGPTLLRLLVLSLSAMFYFASCILFAWKYVQSKSQTIFWYCLTLALLGLALVAGVLTIHLGSAMNWASRLALYLSGAYLLFALLSPAANRTEAGVSGKWIEAFRSNPEQVADFFSRLSEGFAYCKITDYGLKPVDFVYLDVNDAFAKIIEKNKDQIIGKCNSEIFPAMRNNPDAQDVLSVYAKTAMTGESQRIERYSRYTGKWLSMLVYSPKKDHFAVLMEDITERKKAEESVKRQAALIDLSPDAIFVRSLDGTISYWSLGAERLYGYSKQEAIGKSSHDLLRTEFPELLTKINAQIKLTGEWSGELRHKTKSGLEVIVQSRWLIENLKTENISILESNIDITERKKAEVATLKAKEQADIERKSLETTLETMPSAVVIVENPDGKISYINKRASELYGFDIHGLDLQAQAAKLKVRMPDNKPALVNQLPAMRSLNGEVVRNEELSIQRADGKVFPIIASSAPLLDANGKVVSAVVIFEDITERKQLELKLSEYSQHLEKLVEERTKQLNGAERLAAIGATAGMVGHDIRNPLQAIVSDIYIARQETADMPDTKAKKGMIETLDEIEANIFYINKIVGDLQDYARPLNPQAHESDMESVIEYAIANSHIPENIKTEYEIARGARKVIADPDFLKRIVGNLTLNAVQAMPNGGRLTMRVSKDRETGDTILTVNDTGVGIPDSVKEMLFTPMFTTKSKGQGFGLAVVKRMTEGLGGTISFESQVDKGATFTVRLPPKTINGKLVYK